MGARFGTDLSVMPFFAARDGAALDLSPRSSGLHRMPEGGSRELFDLKTVSDRDNLAQALVLRLLTPVGSLAALGHAAYGSRLSELVGRPKTQATRNLCRAFVLEALAQEPRIEPRASAFAFDLDAETVDSIRFTVSVLPRDGGDPIAVALEVGL